GPEPALSLWIRTAPRDAEHFCWRIDVLPAVAASGGLEPGTGVARTRLAPEQAAERLRG
ncbi:MAG: UDPglucose--hexose-phosphate uridylyltransferase, partial [Thermoleophilaceae bacterium]|nr:UDPglucose--hexose-phosphate uridylyltransferase [Thermoleophilaceae bacterium]